MIKNIVYCPVLPPIPNGLLESVDAYDPNGVPLLAIDRYCSKDGVSIPNALFYRYPVSEKICGWINENIASDYTDIGMAFHGSPGGTALPHIDKTRDWALMWLLDEGGPEVDTVYWQEEDEPVIRGRGTRAPVSYDNLIEIDRARYKRGRWLLMDTRIIHSVEGIMGVRKSLQVGFQDSAESIRRFKTTLV